MDLPLNLDYVVRAFTTGIVTTPRGSVRCVVHHIADLALPTGRVVACDPLVFPEAEPFTFEVTPGIYPVRLAVAQVSETDQRVAFANVQLADGEAATWRFAVVPGQDPSTLGSGEIFGYSVDAGTGCFMDAATSALLVQRMNAEEEYYETIIAAMEEKYIHTWSWANVRPSPERSENCVLFSSGWGDGVYASYVGYSPSGEPVSLITDFDVLWREETAPETGAGNRKPWWRFW